MLYIKKSKLKQMVKVKNITPIPSPAIFLPRGLTTVNRFGVALQKLYNHMEARVPFLCTTRPSSHIFLQLVFLLLLCTSISINAIVPPHSFLNVAY